VHRETSNSTKPKLSLLGLYERYADVPGRHPKTIAQWRPYIEHLSKFVGGKAAEQVTHDDLVAWRNHLRDKETYRKKPLSAKTINGSYMGAVSAIYAWAKGDGIVARNPTLEVSKVKVPAQAVTRSKEFTKAEVELILTAALAIDRTASGAEGLRNAKRWAPWLMAYSGARVNEITQLRKEDVFERDGVWVMRITPEAGTVKTKAYRLVPLHSHLIEQGFLKFVEVRADGPIFYDPAKRRSDEAINRQASSLGSRVAIWVRSLGIDGAVKPNHAWRHYFSSYAVRHGMNPILSDVITGHASSNVKEKTYLAGLREQVDLLREEMEKLPRHL
jgi:integrase